MFTFDVKQNGSDVNVKLNGRLEAVVAPKLHEAMSESYDQKVTTVTFDAGELEYISSAGLRVIVMAKQKLGADVVLYLKDASDEVKSVMELTGFSDFVEMV
jgi:anti-sigma B factor antagonist